MTKIQNTLLSAVCIASGVLCSERISDRVIYAFPQLLVGMWLKYVVSTIFYGSAAILSTRCFLWLMNAQVNITFRRRTVVRIVLGGIFGVYILAMLLYFCNMLPISTNLLLHVGEWNAEAASAMGVMWALTAFKQSGRRYKAKG